MGQIGFFMLGIHASHASMPILPYDSNTTYNKLSTAQLSKQNPFSYTSQTSTIDTSRQIPVFQIEEKTQMIASNDFSIVREREQNITWNDRIFRQQDLFENNRVTYGVNSSGTYNKESKDLNIQSWGPYFAWRFPIYKDRIYLENEVSYFKDSTTVEGYSVTVAIKLEATF